MQTLREGMKDASPPVSGVMPAILWMLAGGAAFTVMGALMKYVSQDLPVTAVVFFRMLVALCLLLPWILRRRFEPVMTKRPGLHILRSTTGFLSLMCFVYSLSHLALADAVALSFTTPLWMILTAAVLLREISGPRRWLATAIGFGGVLVIVRPGLAPDPAMVAALAGAFLGSVSLALVKKLSCSESALTITFYFSFVGTILSAVPAVVFWVGPTPREYLFLIATGVFAVAGLMCAARAYTLAEATVVAPVDFSRIPLAAAIGYLLFDEAPDAWTLAGAAIIMASVLYVGRRARLRT